MKKLYRFLKLLRSLFPSRLPTGTKDFEKFYESIVSIYNLPDQHSYKHAVATMIMHLDPLTTWKSKYYFAVSIRKSMANQIAYGIIQQIKEQEKEEAKKKHEEPRLTIDETQDEQARPHINTTAH